MSRGYGLDEVEGASWGAVLAIELFGGVEKDLESPSRDVSLTLNQGVGPRSRLRAGLDLGEFAPAERDNEVSSSKPESRVSELPVACVFIGVEGRARLLRTCHLTLRYGNRRSALPPPSITRRSGQDGI